MWRNGKHETQENGQNKNLLSILRLGQPNCTYIDSAPHRQKTTSLFTLQGDNFNTPLISDWICNKKTMASFMTNIRWQFLATLGRSVVKECMFTFFVTHDKLWKLPIVLGHLYYACVSANYHWAKLTSDVFMWAVIGHFKLCELFLSSHIYRSI